MSRIVDVSAQRFGRLVVVAFSHVNKRAYWECLCDCGVRKIVRGGHLREGTTLSCGCLQQEQRTKPCRVHGHASRINGKDHNSPTYRSWHSMMMRCYNPNSTGYEYWGGRGIAVCEKWRKFSGFLADMGVRPHGCTIDRYPNPDGNYEPENCRWASFAAQTRNRPKQASVRLGFEEINGLLSFGS